MLTDLPEEIIQLIISFGLPGIQACRSKDENHIRQKTLTALLLVNKLLYRICLPSLYHTVDSRDFSWKQLVGVLNAIIRRPDLAGHVKVIRSICWNVSSTWNVDEENSRVCGVPVSLQLTALDEIDCSPARHIQWKRGLLMLDQDAQLALLLSLCTGMEIVDLILPSLFAGSVTRAMLCHYSGLPELMTTLTPEFFPQKQFLIAPAAQGTRPGHHWPNLREVRAANYDQSSGSIKTRMPSLLPILLSSPLQTARLSNIEITNSNDLHGCSFATLKRLYLSRVVMDYRGLTAILAASPLLQVFSVEWHDVGGIKYSELGDALRAHACSLRKLIVKLILKDRVWTVPGSALYPGMGCLQSLEQLRYLSAPAEALFGEQEMPDDEINNNWDLSDGESMDDRMEGHDEDLPDGWAATRDQEHPKPPLNTSLPLSISALRLTNVGRMDEDLFDGQLMQLMTASSRSALRSIRLRTVSEFTGDLEGTGWREHNVNQFWTELRREHA
ncbi:hypothetical protein LTR78_009520 [Recurvomyces mirabilis]|uniref:F-box domain-containing protein n=1 Tax=Recurvomyces mirabilis TaxID=574656 RepID=A0AAE0WHC1_9PEZI|nr:hypothetical protein LTR78_009520 [Recurvomyces mirabilis]KAK5150025.1 hypothetical protein LTS14_010497 [Recurvomyces mirabilis]